MTEANSPSSSSSAAAITAASYIVDSASNVASCNSNPAASAGLTSSPASIASVKSDSASTFSPSITESSNSICSPASFVSTNEYFTNCIFFCAASSSEISVSASFTISGNAFVCNVCSVSIVVMFSSVPEIFANVSASLASINAFTAS